MKTFDQVFARATASTALPGGQQPYPYQRRLGNEGLPELINVPTGLGKTLAVLIAWAYRRHFHTDPAVRQSERSRLVLVMPMRVLVEQSAEVVRSALGKLELDVDVHVLMGGEPMTGPDDWRSTVERDAVVIGTVDMVLSRCLNRGYGMSRYATPIDFGLLNNGSHFVFDEVQLLGPALPTARQLQALREVMGGFDDCSSTYMSATVDLEALSTVDAREIGRTVVLDDDDWRDESVRRRLDAPKRYSELVINNDKQPAKEIAQAAVDHHRSGTMTLVVLNMVGRALDTFQALSKLAPDAEIVLVHARFRPPDRQRCVDAVTAEVDSDGPGRIVVSTQVIEAGVDISAAVLVTDAAPWSSIVQRAGRCNRAGEIQDAEVLWVRIEGRRSLPYESVDVEAACEALAQLEGEIVTSRRLQGLQVAESRPVHMVLRRKDLIQLFDTLPDVSGNVVDVARFIRDADDLDASVAWRDIDPEAVGAADQPSPSRDERCPVPLVDLKSWVKGRRESVRRWDVQSRSWVPCNDGDVRPGVTLLADSKTGGYDPELGWTPKSKKPVAPLAVKTDVVVEGVDDLETGDDPVSVSDHWVTLADHLTDTERAALGLLESLPGTLPQVFADAVLEAAALHDVGKAHHVFRASVAAIADRAGVTLPDEQVFAKSGDPTSHLRHSRKGFRHELVSALWLLECGDDVIESTEADLVIYLVAAHHGRVRLGLRSLQDDLAQPETTVLGVTHGDRIEALQLHGVDLPAAELKLDVVELGGGESGRSWSDLALTLLHRKDLGPFRLGYLEAIVRLADWRASASPTPYILKEAVNV